MWTQWKKQSHIDFLGGGNAAVNQSSVLLNSHRSQVNKVMEEPEKEGRRLNTVEGGLKVYNRME